MTWVAVLGVPVSLGAFLVEHRAAYAWPLAAFLALTGATLFILGQMMLRGQARALAAKLAPVAPPVAPDARPPPIMPAGGLTRRQIEVLRLLADGQSNKDIARALGVSPATVKSHVAQLIAVTGSANRTGAVTRATSLGLL